MVSKLDFRLKKSSDKNQVTEFVQTLSAIDGVRVLEINSDLISVEIDTEISGNKAKVRKLIQEYSSIFDVEKDRFDVLQMSCTSCAMAIQKAVSNQIGVIDADVNFANQSLQMSYVADAISSKEVQQIVRNAGYDLYLPDTESEDLEQLQIKALTDLKQKTIWALVLAFPVMLVGMFFMDWKWANWTMFLFSTPVVLWLGKDFFVNAFKQARHLNANMDTLVAISTGIAYIFSLISWIFPELWLHQHHAPVYFEAAAVVIAFVLLGRFLEERAKGNTSSAIKKLMSLQPKVVTVLENNQQIVKEVDAVNLDELIVVKPGEKLALDGEVISGYSHLDKSSLTGESMPEAVEIGSEVFAGTINQEGSFVFKVTKIRKATLLQQIIEVVQQAQGSKAAVQKKVDKIAGIFVPVVLCIAIITLITWLILDKESGWNLGLLSALTVLVIACPCALGLATPTAIMVGIGKAAEEGILIKNADSLEIAKSIETVILDKTGTITQGKPEVIESFWRENSEFEKAVFYSMESQSEHPLALAVTSHLKSFENLGLHISNHTGKGLSASYESKTYFIGNASFMRENQQIVSDEFYSKATDWENQGMTVIYFGSEKQIDGILGIRDAIKPSSKSAIEDLKNSGIEVIMLTGDAQENAKHIAAEVGINRFESGMLPADKADYIRKLQQNGQKVAMVGDGVNDAAALATADLSIAMGKGSDIAMDVAQITLISSDLSKIPQTFKISIQTVKTIHQNLFWAFIYNIIALPIAAGILYPVFGFLLHPMYAGAAMALSSLSVVGNSLILKYKS